MSDYKFKSFSEIDTVEEPSEEATVVGIENGKPIQMPMKAVKAGGGDPIIIKYAELSSMDTEFGDKVKEGLLNGTPIWIYYSTGQYSRIAGFNSMIYATAGYYELLIYPILYPQFSGSTVIGVGLNTQNVPIPIRVSNDEM